MNYMVVQYYFFCVCSTCSIRCSLIFIYRNLWTTKCTSNLFFFVL